MALITNFSQITSLPKVVDNVTLTDPVTNEKHEFIVRRLSGGEYADYLNMLPTHIRETVGDTGIERVYTDGNDYNMPWVILRGLVTDKDGEHLMMNPRRASDKEEIRKAPPYIISGLYKAIMDLTSPPKEEGEDSEEIEEGNAKPS